MAGKSSGWSLPISVCSSYKLIRQAGAHLWALQPTEPAWVGRAGRLPSKHALPPSRITPWPGLPLGHSVSLPRDTDSIHKEHVFKLQFKSHAYFFRPRASTRSEVTAEALGCAH